MKNKSYSAEKVVRPKQFLAKKFVRPWPDRPYRRRRPWLNIYHPLNKNRSKKPLKGQNFCEKTENLSFHRYYLSVKRQICHYFLTIFPCSFGFHQNRKLFKPENKMRNRLGIRVKSAPGQVGRVNSAGSTRPHI